MTQVPRRFFNETSLNKIMQPKYKRKCIQLQMHQLPDVIFQTFKEVLSFNSPGDTVNQVTSTVVLFRRNDTIYSSRGWEGSKQIEMNLRHSYVLNKFLLPQQVNEVLHTFLYASQCCFRLQVLLTLCYMEIFLYHYAYEQVDISFVISLS